MKKVNEERSTTENDVSEKKRSHVDVRAWK
jgi:hypothetical protein